MWVKVIERPIPTHGMNGKEFRLKLVFDNIFGYTKAKSTDEVIAEWDSTCECFFEKESQMPILGENIVQWWADNEVEDLR